MPDGHTPDTPPRRKRCRANGVREDGLPCGTPRPIDVHVGARVRLRRTLLGMSQEKLGEAVGLTFQQIQKYERGANRIGASRLWEFSELLDVPVSFFFDDMPEHLVRAEAERRGDLPALDTPAARGGDDALARRETLELVRAYYRIADPAVRKRIFELTKSLGRTGGDDPGPETGHV